MINNSQSIIRSAIRKANEPNMKYNPSFNYHVEELSGEPNDRTGYDCGMEMELKDNK